MSNNSTFVEIIGLMDVKWRQSGVVPARHFKAGLEKLMLT